MKIITLFISLFVLSQSAFANPAESGPKNPLSVHVLNLHTGVPSPEVNVVLEKKEGDKWIVLAQGKTNKDGRIAALYPAGQKISEGDYKVTFKTGDYFTENKIETFFPEIPVIFHVKNTDEHYHIPLLLSQYGYTTYRGS